MESFDIVTEETGDGINIRVIPTKSDEYGYPNGFKYRLTIQARNRGHAVNAVRYAVRGVLKTSTFKE